MSHTENYQKNKTEIPILRQQTFHIKEELKIGFYLVVSNNASSLKFKNSKLRYNYQQLKLN